MSCACFQIRAQETWAVRYSHARAHILFRNMMYNIHEFSRWWVRTWLTNTQSFTIARSGSCVTNHQLRYADHSPVFPAEQSTVSIYVWVFLCPNRYDSSHVCSAVHILLLCYWEIYGYTKKKIHGVAQLSITFQLFPFMSSFNCP